jgi:acyl-coenzyme A thioesterase PaaI-like protein
VDEREILAKFHLRPPPALKTLGNGTVVAFDSATDHLTIRWTALPDHCHSIEGHPKGGIVQGGFVAGWLDAAMAHACVAKSGFAVAVPSLEIKVSFLEAAHPGAYWSTGWITRWGKSVAFMEADLRDADKRLIARASSTAALRLLQGGSRYS